MELDEAATRLRKVIRRLSRRGQTVTPVDGPSWPQHAALGWLSERGELTAKTLAQLEGVRPQSMARVLDALEERGWVRRTQDTVDRRQLLVSLTEAGLGALDQGRQLRQAWLVTAMESALTDKERAQLVAAIELLERIAAA